MLYQFNQFFLDTDQYHLKGGTNNIAIEPQVFDLLVYLIENRDRVVSRDELLETLWKGKVVTEAALNSRLKAVRKAIGDTGRAQKIVKTVHGRGYQFVAPVSESQNSDKPDAARTQGSGKNFHPTSSGKPSIIVLPFINRSSDPEDQYFCSAITDEIRLGLSRFRQIVVIARDSSEIHGELEPKFAEASGINYFLQGSVQKSLNKVRISTRLVNQSTGEQIWGEQYDRDLEAIFDIQDEIAQKITTNLAGTIESDSLSRAVTKASTNLTAYDYYLKGNHYFADWRGAQEQMPLAEEMYSKAIELDPEFGPAYSGLASVHLHLIEKHWAQSPEETGEIAFELARKALNLDERDSGAHMILAACYFHVRSDLDLAHAQLEIALNLNPNNYFSYCFKGWLCICSGKLDESRQYANEAMTRNPWLPDDCLWTFGFAEYLAGRYEQAIQTFARISNPDPEVEACLAASHAQLGNSKAARIAVEEFNKTGNNPGTDISSWRKYWFNIFKFKDDAALEHLVEGMRKAGLAR